MVWSDGTTHGRTKHQLFEYFGPDVLADPRDGIGAVTEAQLAAALADGRTFDFAAEVAVPVPLRVVMDLVGVPREDHRQVLSWLETFRLVMNKEYSAAESANPDAMTETVAYFEDLVAERTTDGATLDDRLDVDETDLPPAEYLVTKQHYNFFHRTDIPHILDTYDVDTVILVGFMTHICVHYTAHGAHEHDYAFRVVEEGTASPTRELHEIGLRMLRYLQPRGVRSLEEVTAALTEYGGNPVVERVRETGVVHPDTGPVDPLPGDPDPLATATERDEADPGTDGKPVEPSE